MRRSGRPTSAEEQANKTAAALAEAEALAKEATERAGELEERTSQAEVRAKAAEDQTAQATAKSGALIEDLQKERGQRIEAEERFRRTEERLRGSEERAQQLGGQVQELKSRLSAIKKINPDGMPVTADRERNTLKDAVAGEVRRPLTSILGSRWR
jgi:chromosome segregation ATPase